MRTVLLETQIPGTWNGRSRVLRCCTCRLQADRLAMTLLDADSVLAFALARHADHLGAHAASLRSGESRHMSLNRATLRCRASDVKAKVSSEVVGLVLKVLSELRGSKVSAGLRFWQRYGCIAGKYGHRAEPMRRGGHAIQRIAA
jgi:hypothetical protein